MGSALHHLLMNEATRAFLYLLRSGSNCKKLLNNEIPYVLGMPLLSKIYTFSYFPAQHKVIHPSTQSLPHRQDNTVIIISPAKVYIYFSFFSR